MVDFSDIVGQRFGRLVVREYMGRSFNSEPSYRCQCDCGKAKVARRDSLRHSKTRSCGCLLRDVRAQVRTRFLRW